MEENIVRTVHRTTDWVHLRPQMHTGPEWLRLHAGRPCKELAEAWEAPQKS